MRAAYQLSVMSLPAWIYCAPLVLGLALSVIQTASAQNYVQDEGKWANLNRLLQQESDLKEYFQEHQRLHEVVDQEAGHSALLVKHQQPQAVGTLFLVHGKGQHAHWPHLIAHFRERLPAWGWNTLSLNLDFLGSTQEMIQPLTHALTYAQQQSLQKPFVLILSQESAFPFIQAMAPNEAGEALLDPTTFAGIVLLDARPPLAEHHALSEQMINIQPPLLDIVTQYQRRDISLLAKERKKVLSRRKGSYIQWRSFALPSIQKVDDKRLVHIVRGWLRTEVLKKPIPILTESLPENRYTR